MGMLIVSSLSIFYEPEHVKHTEHCFVDLSNVLNFDFLKIYNWNQVYLPNNLDRQCPFPQSLLNK